MNVSAQAFVPISESQGIPFVLGLLERCKAEPLATMLSVGSGNRKESSTEKQRGGIFVDL